MSDVEFWRNPIMDAIIADIIDIFTNIEGVILVRLSGMTNRARKQSGKNDISYEVIDSIIKKLNAANIIKIHYITKCPSCNETSYQVKYDGISPLGAKICDSCSVLYQLIDGYTLEKL